MLPSPSKLNLAEGASGWTRRMVCGPSAARRIRLAVLARFMLRSVFSEVFMRRIQNSGVGHRGGSLGQGAWACWAPRSPEKDPGWASRANRSNWSGNLDAGSACPISVAALKHAWSDVQVQVGATSHYYVHETRIDLCHMVSLTQVPSSVIPAEYLVVPPKQRDLNIDPEIL